MAVRGDGDFDEDVVLVGDLGEGYLVQLVGFIELEIVSL